MARAKHYIAAESIEKLADTLVPRAPAENPVTIFGRKNSLQSIIHSGFAEKEYDWPSADDENKEVLRRQVVDMLEHFGQENPFRFFGYADGKYHADDDDKTPPGFVLPLSDDPASIGLTQESLLDKDRTPDGVMIAPVLDLEIEFADHGAPAQVHRAPGTHGLSFQRRGGAEDLLGRMPTPRNQDVHVLVVDQGMDPEYVDAHGGPGTYQGVLWNLGVGSAPTAGVLPTEHADRYRSRPQWHAHMVVRNLLAMAGDNRSAGGKIKIWDVPIVPDRVGKVLDVAAAIELQYQWITSRLSTPPLNDRTIIVNAWGVKNRFRETPIGDFTQNLFHPLNYAILRLAVMKIKPPPPPELKPHKKRVVVFAAGNNGLFTPNPEAGQLDRGPMRSIWFPAALPKVWAAAATDRTGKWIGVSSNGPAGATHLWAPDEKPDFTLPSYFSEDLDSHAMNTGTSASCGLLAGMLAAHWRHKPAPPDKLFARNRSRKLGHVGHSNRLGWGVPQHDKFGP